MKAYLKDKDFLLQIDSLTIRRQYVRITVLDFSTEKELEEISGKVSSGNISNNGDSAVRRTANLTFVVDEDQFNLFELNNLLSINKKIKLEIGIENTTNKYTEEKIIWFPQGIYVITVPSISCGLSGFTVSLQLKDKMCLLNGDCGGLIPASTNFAEVEYINGEGHLAIDQPTIYQIIRELVNHYGGEPLYKIIIDGVPTTISQCMTWTGNTPVYAYRTNDNAGGQTYWNITTNRSEAEGKTGFRQFNYGSELAYTPIDFVYGKELIGDEGATITSILDKIKNKLEGNFEYFYDLEGNFIFREKRNFINTTASSVILQELDESSGSYIIDVADTRPAYDFSENPLVISYNISPQYLQVKNDFVVWGIRKTATGRELPIRYHLAIDSKPEVPQEFHNIVTFKYEDSYGDSYVTAKVPYRVNSLSEVTEINEHILYLVVTKDEQDKDKKTYYIWDTSKDKWKDVTSSIIKEYDSYTTGDWRTVLFLQGEQAVATGRASNYYYMELMNEWPRIFDFQTGKIFPELVTDPLQMNYYLDFIDTNTPIGGLCVNNIGRRSKIVKNNEINCLFAPDPIDTVLISQDATKEEKEAIIDECNKASKTWLTVEPAIYDALAVGRVYKTAFEEIRANLYNYTDYNENISMSCIPIFHLDSNTRIHIENKACGINGDYMIKSISTPLGNGTMSLQCTKIIDKL